MRELPSDLAGLEAAMRQGFKESRYPGAVRASHEWLVASSGQSCSDDAALGASRLALLGKADSMFECLGKAIDRKDSVFLKADPVYDAYRADPRFADLLRRMNLAE